MRKFIIDTDTASDDAVAVMIGLLSEDVQVVGITTLCGNISLDMATQNVLMTREICGDSTEVYPGVSKPIFREKVETVSVHGKDGMGDKDLIHPTTSANSKHAVDFILETVRAYPDEVEIVALGPASNIALAILRDPQTMRRVKKIWSMGTSGFGAGNATPVAEFNVYIDAESYKIMLDSGIPITIIGFDLCLGESALGKEELSMLSSANNVGKFVVDCTSELLKYNLSKPNGKHVVDLPDAVAMGVALWDEIVLETAKCNCYCCTTEAATYGQVIFADSNITYEAVGMDYDKINAEVVRKIDAKLFKEKLVSLLIK